MTLASGRYWMFERSILKDSEISSLPKFGIRL